MWSVLGKGSYRCWFCKQEVSLLFRCNYCGKYFCSDHHLPEMHKCPRKPRPAFHIRIPQQSVEIPVYERRPQEQEWRSTYKYRPKRYGGRRRKSGMMARKIALLSSSTLISCLFILFILVNYLPSLLPESFQRFFSSIDITPPKIELISPTEGTYESSDSEPITIPILYTTNEPIVQTHYILNEKEAILISGNTTLVLPPGHYNLLISACDVAGNKGTARVSFAILDTTPPKIRIVSPEEKMYFNNVIPLTLIVNEPISQIFYTLNGGEEIPFSGNTTLNLPYGRYNLAVCAYDRAGNKGFSGVSFIVSRRFNSLNNLINYLRNDDLNRWMWRSDFTCHHFALEFIKRSENRGYYIFEYYALYGEELSAYENTITSIKVVKYYPWGTETRWYEMPIRGFGHAVVKTSLDDMTLIIDPQTDVILKMEKKNGKIAFTVLYEGEITED
ncbi:MAG: AN1-type zinc finger domain-containing protein [Candidatus Bathyarchaeia archaeon]